MTEEDDADDEVESKTGSKSLPWNQMDVSLKNQTRNLYNVILMVGSKAMICGIWLLTPDWNLY
jgi:hypothetical protein